MAMVVESETSSLKPVCSICIANYNGEQIIGDAIKSVYEQDADFPVEIIVHDDASTDGSVELIQKRYPDVMLMVSDQNTGYCVSNNRMAARARGEYILLLNNDATLFPSALKTLHRQASQFGLSSIMGLTQYNAHTGELIDCGSLLDPFLNPVPNADFGRSDVAMIIGACLWIPKRLWDELGGFPEFFGSNAEDLFLCCCARLRGYPVKVVPGSGFNHLVGSSLGGGKLLAGRLSTTFRRRALSERNRAFVLSLVCPSPIIYILLPLHLLSLVIEGILLSAAKRDVDILRRIYLPVFKSLKYMTKNLVCLRKEIQKNRGVSIRRYFSLFTISPYKLRMLLKHGLPTIR